MPGVQAGATRVWRHAHFHSFHHGTTLIVGGPAQFHCSIGPLYTNILQKGTDSGNSDLLALKYVLPMYISIAYCYLPVSIMFLCLFFYLLPGPFATARVLTKILEQQKFNIMECMSIIMVTSCAWGSDIYTSCILRIYSVCNFLTAFSPWLGSSDGVTFCLYMFMGSHNYCLLLLCKICCSCFAHVCMILIGSTAPGLT